MSVNLPPTQVALLEKAGFMGITSVHLEEVEFAWFRLQAAELRENEGFIAFALLNNFPRPSLIEMAHPFLGGPFQFLLF